MKYRFLILVLLIMTFIPGLVLAKGNFTFIVIDGDDIGYEITVTDPALTSDFFAFADFSRGNVEKPDAPGIGYVITRWHTVENESVLFDRLHYYPASGYVFYDGTINGPSEYDELWYVANPEMKEKFNAVLKGEARRDFFTFAGTFLFFVVLAIAFFYTRKSSK